MSRDRNGFSLVEVMIALVVVLLVSLAMMQTALVSIDSNMLNALRDEAVSIVDERMNEARNAALASSPVAAPGTFESLLSEGPLAADARYKRNVRNVSLQYTVQRTVVGYNPAGGVPTKDVTETVTWAWKGQNYNYSGRTLLKGPG